MLFHSAEIRWFFRGDPNPEFDRWFASGGQCRAETPRVDRYLVLPRCTGTGLKIRGDRFEIKAATGAPRLDEMPNGMRGFKGTWVKWSGKLDDAGALNSLMSDASETVLCVEKRRTLRLISLEGNAPAELGPGERQLAEGCQVECARLRVAPADRCLDDAPHWWSFSLEAFGTAGREMVNLDRAARFLLLDDIGTSADQNDSMSYPEWLDNRS